MRKYGGECIFCGGVADTFEHVIPDWMQKEFGLKQKTLDLPNKTQIKYLHAKIPACQKHNTEFSNIENNIKNRIFVPDEVYLWAFKIHVGLMAIDATLKADLKGGTDKPILSADSFKYELGVFREIFGIWRTGEYRFSPSPLGSVFTLPSVSREFDFINSFSTSCIGVNLGDLFLAVFLFDQGHAKSAGHDAFWKRDDPGMCGQNPEKLEGQEGADNFLFHRVWLCQTAYWVYRLDLMGYPISTLNSFSLPFHHVKPSFRAPDFDEHVMFSRAFGVKPVSDDGVNMTYSPLID